MSNSLPYNWKNLDEYCMRVVKNMVVAKLIETKRSIAGAAAELGLKGGGAALSQRLDGVSNFLGGEVNEGSHLSPIGKAMVDLWEDSHKGLVEFIRKIEVLKDERLLRVVTIESTWRAEEKWLRKEYFSRVSGGLIEARYAHSLKSVIAAVGEGFADIGIASFPPNHLNLPPGLKSRIWREEDMVFVMPYWRARAWSETRPTIRAGDMPRHSRSFLMPPKTMVLHKEVLNYLRRNGVRFEYLKPCSDFKEILDRAAISEKVSAPPEAESGVSILPEPVVRKAAADIKVDHVRCDPPFRRPIVVIYREKNLKPNLQKAFLEVLERFKEDPRPHDQDYFRALPSHFPSESA